MNLFTVKIIIAIIGFCFALVNFVRYMEGKDRAKLRWAAICFFGTWVVLVMIKVLEILVQKR